MRVVYDPAFLEKLKKVDVRIRKRVSERIILFSKNPEDPQLDNHPLQREYHGYMSIDITSDWRAIYKEAKIGTEIVAYFIFLGTHKELYGKSSGSF